MNISVATESQNKTNKRNIRLFILLLGVLCIALSLYISYSIWTNAKEDAYEEFHEDSIALEYRLSNQLQNIAQIAVNNAKLAANSPLLPISLSTKDTAFLQQSWVNMFNSSSSLYQIRLLDLAGNEVFRMDRNGGNFKWTLQENLQFKGDRDYFVDGMSNNKAVYISPLDLNKEQEKIEMPIRPTIRAAAKYFQNDEIAGLLVLNYDLRSQFDFFAQQQDQLSHWIMKQNGYFLSTPNDQEWGWLLDKPDANVKQVFSEDFQKQITANPQYHDFLNTYHVGKVEIGRELLETRLTEDTYWVITQLPSATQQRLTEIKLTLNAMTLLIIILVILVAVYVDRLIIRMYKKEEAAIALAELASQSERTKAKFLAQMSHEIRTPMNGVFGLLQLTYGERNQQKINDNLRTALRSFESLRRIIDDILDFSRIEAGKLELVSQAFALDIALKEVSQSMSRAAYGKNIDMWIDIDPACPRECFGDPIRLNQILFNLTNNAIKFTENGEIRLTLSLLSETETQYQLGIELIDTGIGMNKDECNQIFEAFTQASERTHGTFGGTGLGLAIVKQLVNLMQGHISVESERLKGTTFILDVWVNKSEDKARFSDKITHENSRNAEIFIVTESELATSILKKHCSSLGWLTRSFKTIEDLKQYPLANNDNVKIMMVEHKEALSQQQLSQIRDIKQTFSDLIVVHAANADFINHQKQEVSIIDVIIDKPITPSELYDNLMPYTQLDGESVQKKESLTSRQLDSVHILLVEDNDINQMVAKSMLENAGANVSLANNGQECLDMLEQNANTYNVILMDMQMPVMDGVTATREIRKKDVYKDIPIVALTANAMEEEVEACTNAGMQDHVAKPIDKSVLIQTVSKYL